MLALGSSAIAWPEPTLIAAMLTVGLIASLFGLYEVSIAFSIRRRTSRWSLVLAHGIASLTFGLLSVGAPGLPLRLAVVLIAVWFAGYALLAWSAAWAVALNRRLRTTLLFCGWTEAGIAILVLAYPASTIFVLLFFGAVYAAMFGAWQLAVGIWLRRRLRGHDGRAPHGGLVASHS